MQVNLSFIQESRASLTFHCRWSGKFHVVMDQRKLAMRKLANSMIGRNAHVTTENRKQKAENGSPPLPLDLVLRLWDLIGEGVENPLEKLLVRSPYPDLDLRGLRDLK